MKKYIFIATGGIFGSLLRFFIKINITSIDYIPIYTFLANAIGCFFMGFFVDVLIRFFKFNKNLKNFVTVGFLGSLTTYSTFCKEITELLFKEEYLKVFIYFSGTLVISFFMIQTGMKISNILIDRINEI